MASSDGREYALYDFESVADFSEYDSHMMLETCFLGFSPENPVFSEEEGWALSDENSIEFIRDYFREDSSEFADILHALRERYAGVDGERFFRAILREAFAKELMDQEVIERAYARMMGTIGSLMASAREKKLLSSFFALMPPTC